MTKKQISQSEESWRQWVTDKIMTLYNLVYLLIGLTGISIILKFIDPPVLHIP
jgi:hypothetical protein